MVGRLIFIHLQFWEVLPCSTIQRQRCIRILCPKDPEFYAPLALNWQKVKTFQHWRCIKISLPVVLMKPSHPKSATLISESRFSTPLRHAIFFHAIQGKGHFQGKNPSKKAIFPLSRERNRMSQGVENRGSLMSVPWALRDASQPHAKSPCEVLATPS